MKTNTTTLKRALLLTAVPAAAIATLAAIDIAGGDPSPTGSTVAGQTDPPPALAATAGQSKRVYHRTIEIEGQSVFYREAGSKDSPTVLLLHGFPTSSHMFRNLIPELADRYHVVAPDYPGYGHSSMPPVDEFDYSFDHMAQIVGKFTDKLGLDRYSLYLMDYGAPVGFRLATAHPERVEALIIQNGNAYAEGLREFWQPLKAYWAEQSTENAAALRNLLTRDATKWQYTEPSNPRDPAPQVNC